MEHERKTLNSKLAIPKYRYTLAFTDALFDDKAGMITHVVNPNDPDSNDEIEAGIN